MKRESLLAAIKMTLWLMVVMAGFHLVYRLTSFILGYDNSYMMVEKYDGHVIPLRPSIDVWTLLNLTQSFGQHVYSDILNTILNSSIAQRVSLGLASLTIFAASFIRVRSQLGDRQEIATLKVITEQFKASIDANGRKDQEEIVRLLDIAGEVGVASATARGYVQLLYELAEQQGKLEQIEFAQIVLDKLDAVDEQMERVKPRP